MGRGSESDASALLPRLRAIDQNKYLRDAATVILATAQKVSQQQNRMKRIMMARPFIARAVSCASSRARSCIAAQSAYWTLAPLFAGASRAACIFERFPRGVAEASVDRLADVALPLPLCYAARNFRERALLVGPRQDATGSCAPE